MRALIIGAVALVLATSAGAQSVRVKGYVKKDGTYVAPHYRSSPDSSKTNNWSSQGNYNPYTGKQGTQNPYGSTYGSTYRSPYSTPSTKPSSSYYGNSSDDE